jgi:flagellar hook protein FlgE
MLTSLFTGISGMNANGTALSVIGDNIANMNTIGFKASRVTFGDVLSQTLTSGTNNSQVGRGVLMSGVSPIFTQGSFESTGNALDMALDGDGFFIVKDSSGTFYTRAGQFTLDKDGYLVNPDGLRVQGYQYTATGQLTGVIDDINVSALTSSTGPTENVIISANVDSRVTPIPTGFDINDIENTSHFSTAVTVYDSLGNSRIITLYFTKVAEDAVSGNTWEWNAVVDASDSASGNTEVQANGTLQFDNTGALTSVTSTTGTVSGTSTTETFDFGGGAAADQVITITYDNFTQYASESATIFQSQDGFPAGTLKSLSVSQDGVISGIFTNGQIKPVAQLAIAKFMAPTQLTKFGRNLYAESYDSGHAIVGTPNRAGIGRVMSNSLELSNVDLAREFVNMISAQRGFQANSRVITTTDFLLQELVNLVR